MLLAVYGDVDAVYAVTHAESATEFYLIFEVVFLYERLKLFHDLAGTFQMPMQMITFILIKLRFLVFGFYLFVYIMA